MIDPNSREWRMIEKYAKDRIERTRTRLEAHGLDINATEFQRGYAKALRDLLSLAPDQSSQDD